MHVTNTIRKFSHPREWADFSQTNSSTFALVWLSLMKHVNSANSADINTSVSINLRIINNTAAPCKEPIQVPGGKKIIASCLQEFIDSTGISQSLNTLRAQQRALLRRHLQSWGRTEPSLKGKVQNTAEKHCCFQKGAPGQLYCQLWAKIVIYEIWPWIRNEPPTLHSGSPDEGPYTQGVQH